MGQQKKKKKKKKKAMNDSEELIEPTILTLFGCWWKAIRGPDQRLDQRGDLSSEPCGVIG